MNTPILCLTYIISSVLCCMINVVCYGTVGTDMLRTELLCSFQRSLNLAWAYELPVCVHKDTLYNVYSHVLVAIIG